MPPLSSISSSFERKMPSMISSILSIAKIAYTHIPMPSLPSSAPPIRVKAPLPHTPAPSLLAAAVPLETTPAASISPPAYFPRPCLGHEPSHRTFRLLDHSQSLVIPSFVLLFQQPSSQLTIHLSRPLNCDSSYEINYNNKYLPTTPIPL